MKKKDSGYIPPTEIVVDGKIIQMHSSRKERLEMAPVSLDKKKSSIFAQENRHRFYLMVTLIIITVIGTLLSSYFTKNKIYSIDGIQVTLMRRNYEMGHMQTFRVQLKNTTKNTLQLKENYLLKFFIVNQKTGSEVSNREVLITRLTYLPSETFLESIHITDLPDGIYQATWELPNQQKCCFTFKTGRRAR